MDANKNIRVRSKLKKEVNIFFKADHALNSKFLEIFNVYGLNKSDWLRIFIEKGRGKLQKMKYIHKK